MQDEISDGLSYLASWSRGSITAAESVESQIAQTLTRKRVIEAARWVDPDEADFTYRYEIPRWEPEFSSPRSGPSGWLSCLANCLISEFYRKCPQSPWGSALPSTTNLIIHDTAPIVEGATVAETLQNSIALARFGDRHSYHRYWTAETHGMRAVASCAPAVVCTAAAAQTKRIRIGAAGVLLPNHPELVISEQFGTIEALHPRRVDLALGRSLGGPAAVASAINPHRTQDIESFKLRVQNLQNYFANQYHNGVRSVTGFGHQPQMWVLGTNPESAQLAAELRLAYAFGGHLHYAAMDSAIAAYHETAAKDNEWTPHVAVSVGVIAASDTATAQYLAGSHRMKVMRRKIHQERMHLPHPDKAAGLSLRSAAERQAFEGATEGYCVGDIAAVREQLTGLRDRTKANELIISTPIFDHEDRLRSYSLVAESMRGL
ncbi:MsnO8 family LLM class oxidoreductase [Pseudonocardia sp. ICBG601]|uniref:MsnO8 family LLM class oxidoreductase n=1 Tax=Pseudonocardia sp. ICBG601 TaxID=2846759 RepID=UPI001CF69DD1|nr:MsnO8 family LLM class oxidoreductase [Pseudonocardia sp. ICBG601]